MNSYDSEIILNLPHSKLIPQHVNGRLLTIDRRQLAIALKQQRLLAQAAGLRLGQPLPGLAVSQEAIAVVVALNKTPDSGYLELSRSDLEDILG